jgi:hypothetical protein
VVTLFDGSAYRHLESLVSEGYVLVVVVWLKALLAFHVSFVGDSKTLFPK